MTEGPDVAAGQVWRTRKYGGQLEVTAVDDKHVHALVLSVGTPPFFAYTVGTIQRFARYSWEQYHEPAADCHGKRGTHVTTRRFELHRDHDVSGVSGTGVVADGVLWPDGSVSIRWRGDRPSVVFWHSLEDAWQVHGHGGATRFVWLDDLQDLSEFRVQADCDGEMTLEHCPADGDSRCWWEIAVNNGVTHSELAELARAHLADRHPPLGVPEHEIERPEVKSQ